MAKLRVIPCLPQAGNVRYPSKEPDAVPEVSLYRNNLGALSQYQNLLYIAYRDKIHVFSPLFPNQSLSEMPELVIDLPKSRPGLRGYLDSDYPHAINHLVIGDMGNEEILVAACDDGDVISYTTRSIGLVIESLSQKKGHSPTSDYQFESQSPHLVPSRGPVPWFLVNVGKSAWGIAIHKRARLLAVSSNTQVVAIFAPSLGGSECPEIKKSSMLKVTNLDLSQEDRCAGALHSPKDRCHDLEIYLEGHMTNIPNIAFYNTDLDDQGTTFLASTDIDGNTFIWDVWRGRVVLKLYGNSVHSSRGWGVACLDPRASRLTENSIQTFGCERDKDDKSTVIDISEGAHFIPDNSHWHPGFEVFNPAFGANPANVLLTTGQAEIEVDHGEYLEEEVDSDAMGAEEDALDVGLEAASEHASSGPEPTFGEIEGLETAQIEQEDDSESATEDASESSEGVDSLTLDLMGEIQPRFMQVTDRSSYHYKFHIAPKELKRLATRVPARERPPLVLLPFNLLQTSEVDIHLFRDMYFDASLESPTRELLHTRVICESALTQKLPPGFHQLGHIERLNMTAQIPELGVVLIGNQVGRVGVLTATRWEQLGQSGYKIEYILPFKSQEKEGLRPVRPLIGMAVGPIQGQETRPDPGSTLDTSRDVDAATPGRTGNYRRRFRLMLIYSDHTVLSYEISRDENEMFVV